MSDHDERIKAAAEAVSDHFAENGKMDPWEIALIIARHLPPDAEAERWRAIVERLPKCAVCRTPCITIEDGGPEVELTTGNWVCSEACWDRVAEWGNDVKQSTAEAAHKEARDDA